MGCVVVVIGGVVILFSTAESVQLCYTNRNVVHTCVVHIHVVLVVVNNLIRGHYDIIKVRQQWHLVASCQFPSWSPNVPLGVMVWCGHHNELAPWCDGFGVIIVI